MHATAAQGAGYIPQPPAKPLLSAAFVAPEPESPEMKPARPAAAAVPASLRPGPEPVKRPSLFSRVFGGPAAPPASAPHREPVVAPTARHEPEFQMQPEPAREPARAAVRPAQIDEIGLEIPAFLRRTNS
jgi:cell division protein FtsZ